MPRFPQLSPATRALTDTVFSAGALAARARARGDRVYRLHVGDTYLDPLETARAEAQLTRDHRRLHNYSPVHGEPALLDAIVERHRGAVEREDLQVMAGATSGFAVICQTLLDPGDEVLVLAPYWPLICGIIQMRGAVPVEVPFYDRLADSGFDAGAAIDAAVGPHTAAIYVNSPNNPTGCVLGPQAADAIAEVAKRRDLWVLADEAYEAIYYAPEPPTPLWARGDLRERTVATHTLSKSHGLAGARVGYTHGPERAMRAIRAGQTFHSYCAPRPMQLGGARAIREGDVWVAEARRLYAEAGRKAADALGLRAPDGGTFLFFDVTRHLRAGETVMGFLERCVDAGVLLMPGVNSGRAYASWVRLCFTVLPPEQLDDALERLCPVLATP